MNIFHNALEFYVSNITQHQQAKVEGKVNEGSDMKRIEQVSRLSLLFEKHFDLSLHPTINCVETGASCSWRDGNVGLFFAHLSQNTRGRFSSVDINPDLKPKVEATFSNLDLQVDHHINDSVAYLKSLDVIPNLVHLDSWDVDLKNPLPSALHGWREFEAIEAKMKIGSIIVIDDNWYKGWWQEWIYINEKTKEITDKEIINIEYPALGKGAHIYQWVKDGNSNWEILDAGKKLVIKKIAM